MAANAAAFNTAEAMDTMAAQPASLRGAFVQSLDARSANVQGANHQAQQDGHLVRPTQASQRVLPINSVKNARSA